MPMQPIWKRCRAEPEPRGSAAPGRGGCQSRAGRPKLARIVVHHFKDAAAMDTLILFPAEDAFALTAVDLLAALPGQPVTLAAVQTPAKQLAGGLAERVERVFTLPDWPFGPQKGIQPPDPGSPDHARIARFLRQGFDRVLVFDWSLAPLAALMPPGMGRFLVLDDWRGACGPLTSTRTGSGVGAALSLTKA